MTEERRDVRVKPPAPCSKQKYDKEFPAISDTPENIARRLFDSPLEGSAGPKEPPLED